MAENYCTIFFYPFIALHVIPYNFLILVSDDVFLDAIFQIKIKHLFKWF